MFHNWINGGLIYINVILGENVEISQNLILNKLKYKTYQIVELICLKKYNIYRMVSYINLQTQNSYQKCGKFSKR